MSRVVHVWRMLNLPCCEVARLASESLDRDLDRWERLALRTHIVYCVACRRYRRQLVRLRTLVRDLATHIDNDAPLPGPGLPEDARARIKEVVREE